MLLDGDQRVLLLHGLVQEDPQVFAWYAPGGRLEQGESFTEALARELNEELGLTGIDIGPLVWTRNSTRRRGVVQIPALSHFFLIRVPAFTPDLSGIGESEIGVTWRWWTREELVSSRDRFLPPNLSDLVEPLMHGILPLAVIDAS